jgi:hypothetical protein
MLADYRVEFLTKAVSGLAISRFKKLADLSSANPLTFNYFCVNLYSKTQMHMKKFQVKSKHYCGARAAAF